STVATRSLLRERAARKEAETLLEQKSLELYENFQHLRQLNSHLEDSEMRYRTLVELAPDAIWIHSDGIITFLNPAAVRLFGAATAEDLIGQSAIERFPQQYHKVVDEWTGLDLHKVHEKPRGSLQVRRMDGNLVDVEFFGCEIRFNNE